MRWTLFFILLVLAYVAQTALLPQLALPWLDLLLATALVCGLAAPAVDARLAGWIVGFAKDIDTDMPIGLHAFVLGLAVLALTHLRELVNLNLWWVRWLVGFVVAFPAEVFVRVYHNLSVGAGLSIAQILGWSLTSSVVAAFLATFVLALPMAFRPRRRRSAAGRW
jgi:rod shape-determining protein MreD